MKTNQIMESIDRELAGHIVPQRTCDGFFSLGACLSVINLDRLNRNLGAIDMFDFIKNQNVKEFISELELKIGGPAYYKGHKTSRGWIHPFLALKLLTHYNPKFEIQVYEWLFDYLIKYRIDSGDSFNKMSGALFKYAKNKAKFPQGMIGLSKKIRLYIGLCETLTWNKATQEQLSRRDELQNLIADLAETLGDNERAINIAFDIFKRKYLQNSPKDLF